MDAVGLLLSQFFSQCGADPGLHSTEGVVDIRIRRPDFGENDTNRLMILIPAFCVCCSYTLGSG